MQSQVMFRLEPIYVGGIEIIVFPSYILTDKKKELTSLPTGKEKWEYATPTKTASTRMREQEPASGLEK